MKKLYPVAIRFMLGGAAIALIALVLCGFDLRQLNTKPAYRENTLGITEDVQRIEIRDSDALVMVEQAKMQGDVQLEIVCMESEDEEYLIFEEDGTLIVEYRDSSRSSWINVNFGSESRVLKLILPEDSAHELDISVDSGAIHLQEIELAGDVSMRVTSGSICATGVEFGGNVSAGTSSGVIELCDVRAGDVRLEMTSGHAYVYNTHAAGAEIELTSGYFYAQNLRADSLQFNGRSGSAGLYDLRVAGDVQAKVSSGSVRMESPVVGGLTEIESGSGSIEFELADFAELNLSVMSGDVRGSLLECADGYAFEAETGSGDVDVPQSDGSRPVRIETGSGDIRITIEK